MITTVNPRNDSSNIVKAGIDILRSLSICFEMTLIL